PRAASHAIASPITPPPTRTTSTMDRPISRHESATRTQGWWVLLTRPDPPPIIPSPHAGPSSPSHPLQRAVPGDARGRHRDPEHRLPGRGAARHVDRDRAPVHALLADAVPVRADLGAPVRSG